MAHSARGKFVIDALALPPYVAGISEMQRCRAAGKGGMAGNALDQAEA